MQVVAALIAGGVGLPIPEELALITAGYWLSRGVDPLTMLGCAVAAVLAGDCGMVLAGRFGARLARRYVGAARLASLERSFARRGVALLLAGRFVPGLRAALLVTAGAARLPLRRIAAADGAAALVGATLWIAIGWRLAPELEGARAIVASARGVVLVIACVAVAALVIERQRRRSILTNDARSAREPSHRERERPSRSRERATHP